MLIKERQLEIESKITKSKILEQSFATGMPDYNLIGLEISIVAPLQHIWFTFVAFPSLSVPKDRKLLTDPLEVDYHVLAL